MSKENSPHVTSFLISPADAIEVTEDTVRELVTAMVNDNWCDTPESAHVAFEEVSTALYEGDYSLRDFVCYIGRHLGVDVTNIESLVLTVQ